VSYTQRRNFLWVLFAIGMISIAIVANATTLVHSPFQQLVGYSSAIARVQCVGSDVRLENGEIWTNTRFHVLETVKGFLPGTIVVRQPGGKFQNLHSHVDGSPEFRRDEEVYLFLIGKPGKQFNVVGWSQGTFRIRRDTRTGVETVTQDSRKFPSMIRNRKDSRKRDLKTCELTLLWRTFTRRLCVPRLRRIGVRAESVSRQFARVVRAVRKDERAGKGKTMSDRLRKFGACGIALLFAFWSNIAAYVWTGVSGTMLTPSSLGPLTRISSASGCGSDGINSICFDQPDMAFTPGVLAFTRVVTADRIGLQLGKSPVSREVGQILDADIYFNPSDSMTSFATSQALSSNPKSYDLQSILIHELGHTLGFSHSAVWSVTMFPFAPAPGTTSGVRPTAQFPDAPLGEDDRTGCGCCITIRSTSVISAQSRATFCQQIPSHFPRHRGGSPVSLAPTLWPSTQTRVR
jgi:hypothetical protein